MFSILLQRSGTSTIQSKDHPALPRPGDLSINSGSQAGLLKIGADTDMVLTVVPSALIRQLVGFAHEDGAVAVPRESRIARLMTLSLQTLIGHANTMAPKCAQHLRDGLLQAVAAAIEPGTATTGEQARLAA